MKCENCGKESKWVWVLFVTAAGTLAFTVWSGLFISSKVKGETLTGVLSILCAWMLIKFGEITEKIKNKK